MNVVPVNAPLPYHQPPVHHWAPASARGLTQDPARILVTGQAAICKYPGCENPPEKAAGPGRAAGYCADPGHNRVTAWRERRRLDAERHGEAVSEARLAEPVTTARRTGADLMRDVHALAARLADVAGQLRAELETICDPAAHEAETTAARAAAEQRAAEEMAGGLDQAQADAARARDDLDAALRQHAAETEQIRADADARVQAAEASRDTAIEQAAPGARDSGGIT